VVKELPDFFFTSNRAPVSTPIKRTIAMEGSPFILGISSSFLDQDKDLLTFRLEGLPIGSGLLMNPINGILSGTPSHEDAMAMQPLLLTVFASDGKGGVAAESFHLTVFLREATNNNALHVLMGVQSKVTSYRSALFSGIAADASAGITDTLEVAFEVGRWGSFKSASMFSFFSEANRTAFEAVEFSYRVTGLPERSGLVMDARTGMLSGTASIDDAIAAYALFVNGLRPITVVADCKANGVSTTKKQGFLLRFLMDSDINNIPFARTIPRVTAVVHEKFLLDVCASFSDPDGDPLRFSLQGLPAGSGLTIVPNSGVIFGQPSAADVNAQQPILITILAEDGRGGRVQENLLLEIAANKFDSTQATTSAISVNSCKQLGWSVHATHPVCSRTPASGCDRLVNFSEAKDICSTLGTRLCTSPELSDARWVDENADAGSCNNGATRVWTSSTCAFNGQVVTQAGSALFLNSVPKQCASMQSADVTAGLRCCADTASSTLKIIAESKGKSKVKGRSKRKSKGMSSSNSIASAVP
jgi:hypothetical protein